MVAGREFWGKRMELEGKFEGQGWKLGEGLGVKDGDFAGKGWGF